MTGTINVFLTNLGKYNEGILQGEWVALPVDEEELQEVFKRIGISSEPDAEGNYYEEYFITDYETDFDLQIGEYENINKLNELAEELESLDSSDIECVKAQIEAYGCDLREAIDSIDRCIFYSGRDMKELAEELADEQIACYTHEGKVPEFFTRYFDYEAFQRDLECDYTETSFGCIYRS